MGYTIAEMRDFARGAGKNLTTGDGSDNTTTYPTADVDACITQAADYLLDRTQDTTSFTHDLTADDPQVDLTGDEARFTPSKVRRVRGKYKVVGAWATATAYLKNQVVTNGGSRWRALLDHTSSATDEPDTGASYTAYWAETYAWEDWAVDVVDYDQLQVSDWSDDSANAPVKIAWRSPSVALVWPKPNTEYTLQIEWLAPCTSWTFGTAAASQVAVELNLQEDAAMLVARLGAPALLEMAEVQDAPYAARSWRLFQEEVERMRRNRSASGRATGDMSPSNGGGLRMF